MITKVTKENRALYEALFSKASIRLNENADPGAEEISISSLDDFFCSLTDLRNKEEDDQNLDHTFDILPADEPFFEIDANTRVITVPSEFKKNGISVKGDHLAEILFFSIDRYYDDIDLANDVSIFVQCEVPKLSGDNGTKSETYLCSTVYKDITILKNQGKMVFGWPINSLVTERQGVIKFSVRFIHTTTDPDTNKKKIDFSLSTLTASATVNPGLDFTFVDGESSVQIIDNLATLKNRIRDSIPYNTDEEAPMPEIILNIPASSFDSITEDEITYLLTDLGQDGIKLIVQAVSNEGIISYEWHKADLANGIHGDVISGSDEYVPSSDTSWSSDYIYYTKSVVDNRDVYEIFDVTGLDPEEDDIPELYIKCNSVTVNSTGNYWVVAKNRKGIALSTVTSNYVRIPGPEALSVVVDDLELGDDDIYHVILDENGEFEIVATGSTARLGSDTGVGDKITYTWTEQGENDDPLIATAINDVKDNGVESSYSGTVEEADKKLFDHTIKLTTIASRNGASTDPRENEMIFRITDAASAPIAIAHEREATIMNNVPVTLQVDVSTAGIISDELTYQWYRITSNTEDEDFLIEGATESTLEVDGAGAYYCLVTNKVNGSTATTSRPVPGVAADRDKYTQVSSME